MRSRHEDISERLPGYVLNGCKDRDIEAHLKECGECRHEASTLRKLHEIPVPEPGGMFFETLPQQVRVSVKKQKPGFFTAYAPVIALILFVITSGYVYHLVKPEDAVENLHPYSSPLAPQIYDFTDLSEDDIPLFFDESVSEALIVSEDTPFLREFASLSSEELEALSGALAIPQKNGGV